ncbi:unnamed protein product [Lasius platythorax]|uniref:Uncharacterized protein n=1 Tax=Lasius platythorax TaxID=488582 RepID=A0AAV2P7S4_9HYME
MDVRSQQDKRDRRRRERSLVQEGSRLQLRRLGVAGRKHEAVTVEDGNPKGPEAIPDFQIEGDREAGRQQSPCSFP